MPRPAPRRGRSHRSDLGGLRHALRLLPPRQRAVLILRDVLGFRASEAAGILDCTEESVTSALKRARAALQYRRARSAGREPPPPGSARERALVQRFTPAYEAGDVDEVVALLTEDAWLIMPPVPLRYQGYGQGKHETHSGPASPCVEALARPRRRVWPPEGLPVL